MHPHQAAATFNANCVFASNLIDAKMYKEASQQLLAALEFYLQLGATGKASVVETDPENIWVCLNALVSCQILSGELNGVLRTLSDILVLFTNHAPEFLTIDKRQALLKRLIAVNYMLGYNIESLTPFLQNGPDKMELEADLSWHKGDFVTSITMVGKLAETLGEKSYRVAVNADKPSTKITLEYFRTLMRKAERYKKPNNAAITVFANCSSISEEIAMLRWLPQLKDIFGTVSYETDNSLNVVVVESFGIWPTKETAIFDSDTRFHMGLTELPYFLMADGPKRTQLYLPTDGSSNRREGISAFFRNLPRPIIGINGVGKENHPYDIFRSIPFDIMVQHLLPPYRRKFTGTFLNLQRRQNFTADMYRKPILGQGIHRLPDLLAGVEFPANVYRDHGTLLEDTEGFTVTTQPDFTAPHEYDRTLIQRIPGRVHPDWSWLDTLQVLSLCDHVVTVDTAMAHAAGAIGTATHVICNHMPGFAWANAGLPGAKSKWYETVRVHAQTMGLHPRDWHVPLRSAADLIFNG